jgi:hypothetical protein
MLEQLLIPQAGRTTVSSYLFFNAFKKGELKLVYSKEAWKVVVQRRKRKYYAIIVFHSV